MRAARKIRLVMNPRSGTKDLSPETLCAQFARHGCECSVTLLDRRVDLAALHAIDPGDVVWIAAGGDGTVNCVAHAVVGSARSMGLLPTGTLNHFAQDLGIPEKLEDAVEFAATGEPRAIDAAEVNGRTFVNNSSLGVYPATVVDRDRMCRRGAGKWWAMAIASVRVFIRFRRLRVSLDADGKVRQCRTPLLFVGSNVYEVDGMGAGRRKCMDEGVLSIFFVSKPSRMCMLRLVGSALAGKARTAGDLEVFHVERFVVDSPRRRLRVALDGEVHSMKPPLTYISRPGALRVIAPPPVPLDPEAANAQDRQ